MPLSHDQVLAFVRQHGPTVPNDIRQALKAQDNFVVGAILGELVSAGKLKMTNFSLGTSRFYYDPEHPETLERVMQHQNEKDARAAQLLKERQLVKNSELEPLMRVAMTNIPDYARSLRVQTPTGEELYWRYYLFSEQDAHLRMQSRFSPVQKTVETVTTPTAPPSVVRFGKKETKLSQKSQQQLAPTPVAPSLSQKPEKTEQKLVKPVKEKIPKKEKTPGLASGFSQQVHAYFETKQIGMVEALKATKTELTCIVTIPSAVGTVMYYCKAKAKKSTNEGDLASALLEAQEKKLPLCYVAGGSLSKKAQALVGSQFKGSVVVTPWA